MVQLLRFCPFGQFNSTSIGSSGGWTTFTPSVDTHIIYVSQSTGNNGTAVVGDITKPYQTLAAAVAQLRDGFPDWLLLKAGDTWTNEVIGSLTVNGRSASEPMLISYYGAGARPVVKTPQASALAVGSNGGGMSNTAIVGIEFYCYQRNPNDPGYVSSPSTPTGLGVLGPVTNFLVEGCKFSFYQVNNIQGFTGQAGVVTLRRNIICDCYPLGGGNTEGIYIDTTDSPILIENLFDHNGWNETIPVNPTVFNHNVYIQADCGQTIFTGNISTWASATGAQIRPGGTVTGNMFVRDPVSFQTGSSQAGQFSGAATVTGNVTTEGNDMAAGVGTRGWGLIHYPNAGNAIGTHSNIFAHCVGTQPVGISCEPSTSNITATNNILFDWPNAIQDNGTGNTTTPNAIDQAGYLDPNRSVATYMASIGQTATLAAFLAAAKNQSKQNWNTQYMAAAVNAHIAAGFV